MDNLAKNTPFEDIAQKGAAIYERDRTQYEPEYNGKFLAIEAELEKKYIGDTAADALVQARSENPGKLFYLVKIGFSSAETLAHSFLPNA